MRVLYLSQYFPPENGATQARSWEMARGLARAGHHVTVLAEVPNHPGGVVRRDYRRCLWRRRREEGVEVLHLWVATSPVKTTTRRLAFYGSYAAAATLAGLALRGRFDLLYATSPPLPTGAAALLLSRMRGVPLVFEVRDLWPESAVAVGELTSPRAIAWATRLEEACYRRARRVVVVTSGIRDTLLRRGLPAAKVELIPNSANTSLFVFSAEQRRRVRDELGLGSAFTVVYAGLLGVAQGVEVIAGAAQRLAGRADIRFVLLGDGPERGRLEARLGELRLPNLNLLPEQPRASVPSFLSAADAVVVPLRDAPVFAGAVPSKIFDAWACERAVLIAAAGEGCALVCEVGGGLCVPPERPEDLARAIVQLAEDPIGCAEMGRRGRQFTAANRSREAQSAELARLLEEVVG